MNPNNTNLDTMTDGQINDLIDKMCTARQNNPEVRIMDSIQRRNPVYVSPEDQEKLQNKQDEEAIEADLVRGIFEHEDQLSIEEINALKAQGIYDKYKRNSKEDKDDMAAIEAEIRASLAREQAENELTEVISDSYIPEEEVTFQNANTETIPTVEAEVASTPEETTETEVTAEEIIGEFNHGVPKEPAKKAALNALFGLPAAVAMANEGKEYVEPELTVTESEPTTSDENPDLDLPASELEVADDEIVKSVTSKYTDVSTQDALQLISVMNRFRNKEKFNVFDALPASIKNEIMKTASAAGADRSTINFFAKSFINSLIDETYIDKEIQDFNQQLNEAMAPVKNVTGTLMDEYSDDIYNKFTTGLREKADALEAESPDKAAELRGIADRFESACNLTNVVDTIVNNPGFINRAFKTGRDRWNDMQYDYATAVRGSNPEPKPLADCLKGMLSINIPEGYAKTILYFVKKEIVNAIEEKTLPSHIYAYYMSNALATLAYSARNSKSFKIVQGALGACTLAIDSQMATVRDRKNGKKDKKKKK